MTNEDVFVTLTNESMIENLESPPLGPHSAGYPGSKRRPRGRPRLSSQNRVSNSNADKPVIPVRYVIRWDRDYVEAVLRRNEQRGYLTLAPERLKYHPFLVTRNPIKPPGAIAQATLKASHGNDNTNGNIDGTDQRQADGRTDALETNKVVHGEDQATLDLVAALSASPKRSLRARTSSEYQTGAVSPSAPATPAGRTTRAARNRHGPDGDVSDDPLLMRSARKTPGRRKSQAGRIVLESETGSEADAEGEDAEDLEWGPGIAIDA